MGLGTLYKSISIIPQDLVPVRAGSEVEASKDDIWPVLIKAMLNLSAQIRTGKGLKTRILER